MIYLDYSANTPVDEAVLQRFCEVERNFPGQCQFPAMQQALPQRLPSMPPPRALPAA